jgi:hypothetical protein
MRPAGGDDCNSCTCMNGNWSCTMKFCGQLNCDAGRADCDADPANGCETDVESSVENCGRCGYVCNLAGGSAACEAGMCVPDQCDAPYADCNGDPTDGCEVPVGEGGCADRCEPADPALVPIAAGASCECPEGMACVRRDLGNVAACIPIPEGCSGGFANCLCMADCACGEGSTCSDEMSRGGMIINCATSP